jgi:hypothetical protein
VSRRRRLLSEDLDVVDRARLALGEGGQQGLLALLLVTGLVWLRVGGRLGLDGGCRVVDREEAGIDDDGARRAEQVAGRLRVDGGDLLAGRRVEGGKEAARDEVVDLALVGANAGQLLRPLRRDDRVVVTDLVVGDDANWPAFAYCASAPPTFAAIVLSESTMSVVRYFELVRGYVSSLCVS